MSRVIAAALVVCGCAVLAGAVPARADAGDRLAERCVVDDFRFETSDGRNHFRYVLRNLCGHAFSCTARVNLSTEAGARTARATLVLPKARSDRPSEWSRTFPVGGVTHAIQAGKSCRPA